MNDKKRIEELEKEIDNLKLVIEQQEERIADLLYKLEDLQDDYNRLYYRS